MWVPPMRDDELAEASLATPLPHIANPAVQATHRRALQHAKSTVEAEEAHHLMEGLDWGRAAQELAGAVAFLRSVAQVGRVGVVGFCMGGRLVLMTALADENVGAAVAFYGQPLTPEEAPAVKAPVLGLYGGQDSGIPMDSVAAMQAALAGGSPAARLPSSPLPG